MRRVVILVSSEIAGLALLFAVRHTVAPSWSLEAPPGDVIASAVWCIAVTASIWLLVVTIASLVVEALPRAPRTLRVSVASVTPRMIRVVVTRAVAVSMISTTSVLTIAPGVEATVRTGREPTTTTTTTPATTPMATGPMTSRDSGPAPTNAAALDDGASDPTNRGGSLHREYRVEPGDNLWSIAASHLPTTGAQRAGDAEIATYWALMIEANRPHLISGDPDLIYPGEIVVLPEH